MNLGQEKAQQYAKGHTTSKKYAPLQVQQSYYDK